MLVSILTYREITGDSETSTAEVERVLLEAEGLLVEELRRHLEQSAYTETLTIESAPHTGVGQIFPSVTPIISVDGGLTVRQDVVYGPTPDGFPAWDAYSSPPAAATVTYTGGFDPDETDPTEVDYVPRYMRRDISWAAWALLQPSQTTSTPIPAGVKSASSGDQSVTFADGKEPGSGDSGISWSCETLRWKRR